MPKTHVVKQGETLNRIARQYGFADGDDIYNHDSNKAFREKRTNPNVIFPGDEVTIPDIEDKFVTKSTGGSYIFLAKRPVKDKLTVQLTNKKGKPWKNRRLVLDIGGKKVDAKVDANGMMEIELPEDGDLGGGVTAFMDGNDSPALESKVEVGKLDPVEELSGVQARCNALGFPCGVADGLMGQNTRNGVKAFQKAHGLDVDGQPGPMTKKKLKEVYGC